MPKNKFFFTVLLTLTLILGGMVLTVKAQPTPTPTDKTPLQIISSEQFLRRLEENLPKDTKPVYVFSGAYQRLFYRPANKNWSGNLLTIPTDVPAPYKGGQDVRSGVILPLIQNLIDNIDPATDIGANTNVSLPASVTIPIIKGLKNVCDQQCDDSRYNSNFQLCFLPRCTGGGKDEPPKKCTCASNLRWKKATDVCYNQTMPGGTDGLCVFKDEELKERCREYECSVTEECPTDENGNKIVGDDCDLMPYNKNFSSESFNENNAFMNKYRSYSWIKDAYENCYTDNFVPSNYQPTWCDDSVSVSDPPENGATDPPENSDDYKKDFACNNDDRRMMCVHDNKAMPALTKATVDCLAALKTMFYDIGSLGDLYKAILDIMNEMLDELENYILPPVVIGGGYKWSKTPEETNIIDEPGFCLNKNVSTCSCGHILPFNGSTITNLGLRRKLLSYGVADANKYCVNTEGDPACTYSYSWDTEEVEDKPVSRNTKVGMRNIYASRASYPGWVTHKGGYVHGATCAKRPKGSSIGGSESGSKTRTFEVTDKEFFFLQARYFADKIARGESDELSYGGCDDRSNILYNHATAAHCQRKGKRGIKCRSGSRRRFSSYACDINGGVINQCKNGRVDGGRNTICQVCGPIYCGEHGLYSDTNTVRKNFKLGNSPTRHYKFYRYYHPQGSTKYGGGDEGGGGTIDGSEIFYSYSSQICLGERCNSSYNDAVFTPRDLPANSGQVFDDRTCPEGEIVDPCKQRAIANNWGGHRLCYESCCVSSDGSKCDRFPHDCPPGECCEDDDNSCRQPADNYHYGGDLCSIGDDTSKTVSGVAIPAADAEKYANYQCNVAGTYDTHYPKSVAESYTFPLKEKSACYFCGCAPIEGNSGKSGWWPRNAKIKHGDQCLTPEQKCAAEFNQVKNNKLEIGYDGLAQAMDRSDVDSPVTLLKGITGMTNLRCVRCRCVAGDGICDGYSGDPNGVCKNYPQGTLDPDCDPLLPSPGPESCGPSNCKTPGACSCKVKPGYNLTEYPYGDDYGNHPQCRICIYKSKPTGCGDGICSGLETCENCSQDCGKCPQMSECPDGYSKLCTGEGYPVTGLGDCKRCYDPNHLEQPQHGCQDDGYCNPLCEEKDADCEPETAKYLTNDNGCPYGYGKTKECGYGERHPLLSGCYACGCERRKKNFIETKIDNPQLCDKDDNHEEDNCDIHMKEFSCSPYDNQNNSGLHWKVVTLAQQQQIYRDSLCYGYQFFTTKEDSSVVTVGVDVSYYDYQQRDAWMLDSDGKGFIYSDAKGGYRRCRPVRMPYRGGSLSSGKAGLCEYRCIPAMHQAIVLSCSEIDARYPHEYRGNPSDEMVFIPDVARSAGNKEVYLGGTSEGLSVVPRSNDARCGRYYRVYPKHIDKSETNDINGDGKVDWQDGNAAASYLFTDWWQVGGNAYGNAGVSNYGEKTAFVAEPAEVKNLNPATAKLVGKMKSYQYALNDGSCITSGGEIKTGDWQPPTAYKPSSGAGLQVTGSGNPTTLINKRTYRPSNQTGLAAKGGYQFSYQKQRALDFEYYRTLLDYEKIPKNGSSRVQVKLADGNIEETFVYRFFGRNVKFNDDIKPIVDSIGVDKKVVIFVESQGAETSNVGGNFILDANMASYDPNGYLAVIAQKDFIIEPQVGYHLNTQNGQGCGINTVTLCTPSFNGVVIARGLVMKREGDGSDPSSNPTLVDGLFNPQLTCDKRLVLKGAYAFWGKQPVVFTRTLLGCGLKKGPFSNDKASLNVHNARGNAHGDDFEGRRPDVKLNNKNAYDDYCRTGTVRRNGNGYYNYHLNWPDSQGGMYNNYNRLISATQLVVNQQLINLTPAWMRQNLTTRLEVR